MRLLTGIHYWNQTDSITHSTTYTMLALELGFSVAVILYIFLWLLYDPIKIVADYGRWGDE